jgi:tetratricopeptide (TPR) repeat protein
LRTGTDRFVPAREIARDLHAQAVLETNHGHPSRAIALSNRALAVLSSADDSPESGALRVRLWLTLGLNQAETSGFAGGEIALLTARDLADRLAQPALAMLVSGQTGLVAMRAGRFEEALGHLDRAVELLHETTPTDQARVLFNRGAANLCLGRVAQARSDIARSLQVADQSWLANNGGKAKHNLGYAEFLSGNLPRALELMSQAAAEVPHHLGVYDLNRALVLVDAGLTREAADTLLRAEKLLRQQRQWQDVGEVELARAECALLSGDPGSARQLAARARDRFRRRGSQRWLWRSKLLLLQADLAYGRPGARLAGPALAVAAQLSSAGRTPEAATAYRVAAQALLRTGHSEQAEQAAQQAGPVRAGDPITARLHASLVRAELSLAQGQTARARTELRTGLRELASYQARFGSIDLQTASAVHGRRLAQLDLAIALRTGRPGEVLAAVERGRATSTRVVSLRPPADPEEAELLSQLRVAVDAAREARLTQDETEEFTQRRLVADLQQRLRDRAWTARRNRHGRQRGKRGRRRGDGSPARRGAGRLLRLGRATGCRRRGQGGAECPVARAVQRRQRFDPPHPCRPGRPRIGSGAGSGPAGCQRLAEQGPPQAGRRAAPATRRGDAERCGCHRGHAGHGAVERVAFSARRPDRRHLIRQRMGAAQRP